MTGPIGFREPGRESARAVRWFVVQVAAPQVRPRPCPALSAPPVAADWQRKAEAAGPDGLS